MIVSSIPYSKFLSSFAIFAKTFLSFFSLLMHKIFQTMSQNVLIAQKTTRTKIYLWNKIKNVSFFFLLLFYIKRTVKINYGIPLIYFLFEIIQFTEFYSILTLFWRTYILKDFFLLYSNYLKIMKHRKLGKNILFFYFKIFLLWLE